MKIIVPGFQFAGIHCGIKDNPRKKDLTLIYSDEPQTIIDGVFTKNRVCAAPVIVSRRVVSGGYSQLVVVNSGSANACTGKRGLKDVVQTQREAAKLFGLIPSRVVVCSTGKIGEFLPMKKLLAGLVKAKDSLDRSNFMEAAKGIMTTDQFVKYGSVKDKIQGKKYTISVMTKGAGMLRPDMATMLTFLMTNLQFDRKVLALLFRQAVDATLNRVTVDGDMSTNDAVLIMANGQTGNSPFSVNSPEGRKIGDQLTNLLTRMAHKITLDGEGATKCCEVKVTGAPSEGDAKKIAYAIGNSPLVKTALFGCDPNWGRIMAAVGYSGAMIHQHKINIHIGPYLVAKNGQGVSSFRTKDVSKYMRKKNMEISIKVGSGRGEFYVYMSDLTYEYIHLNAEYHT